ncbi:MAG: hypothetical protein IK061_04600 [Desulfovibrio sp.]|nr:hypothetical protein [Desulfovibrio sp.]
MAKKARKRTADPGSGRGPSSLGHPRATQDAQAPVQDGQALSCQVPENSFAVILQERMPEAVRKESVFIGLKAEDKTVLQQLAN